MKSSNCEDKVLASEIDFAELLSLLSLYHICCEIKGIHAPGAEIIIYAEEPFLQEMSTICQEKVGVPLFDEEVMLKYQRDLRSLIKLFDPVIQMGSIPDLPHLYQQELPRESSHQSSCDKNAFMKEELACTKYKEAAYEMLFRTAAAQIPELVSLEESAKLSYQAFCGYCLTHNKKLLGRIRAQLPMQRRLTETAHALAECYSAGAIALREIIRRVVPEYESYIRLSVRGDMTKLGIQLILGSRGTPWHNCLLLTKQGAQLVARGNYKQESIEYYRAPSLDLSFAYLTDGARAS